MNISNSGKAHWLSNSYEKKLENSTINDYFNRQVEKYADSKALIIPSYDKLNIIGVEWTYKTFQIKIKEFAKVLLAEDFKKGDRIAAWSINLPEWLVLQMACASIGIILVAVNPALRTKEVKYVLDKSEAQGIFVLSEFANRNYVNEIKEIREGLPLLKNIYTFNDYKDSESISYKTLLDRGNVISEKKYQENLLLVNSNDIFQIQFTSGTTGFPKAAMLTHYNALNNAISIFNRWEIQKKDRAFSPLPLFHSAGSILMALASITVGATYITQPFFEQADALKIMKDYKVTHFGGVPTMLQGVINELEKQNEEINLTMFMSGGSPVSEELIRKLEEKTNSIGVALMGLTETAGIFSATKPSDSVEKRYATSGQPLPHTEVKIVKPNTQEINNHDIPGEILIRGYMVMKGYYNMEEETNAMIDEEGWLRTEDIGLLDKDGFLYVIGRLKDMIIRGGENIYPREIEEYLTKHPKVNEAAVIGVPENYYGEVPIAFVKTIENEKVTEKEIFDFCEGKLSHQKTPVRIILVNEFPLTSSGKILKSELKKQYFNI